MRQPERQVGPEAADRNIVPGIVADQRTKKRHRFTVATDNERLSTLGVGHVLAQGFAKQLDRHVHISMLSKFLTQINMNTLRNT
jgi:hypothetical protein